MIVNICTRVRPETGGDKIALIDPLLLSRAAHRANLLVQFGRSIGMALPTCTPHLTSVPHPRRLAPIRPTELSDEPDGRDDEPKLLAWRPRL